MVIAPRAVFFIEVDRLKGFGMVIYGQLRRMRWLAAYVTLCVFIIESYVGGAISVIPQPTNMEAVGGEFLLRSSTQILVESGNEQAMAIGLMLGERIQRSTGYALSIVETSSSTPANDSILLTSQGSNAGLGEEGYELSVSANAVAIQAPQFGGLFYGTQTLRQLLPLQIESEQVVESVEWTVPCVNITDQPRFQWRGLMLDCSRTFWSKEYVKRYIDLLALYKMNIFHLHLTDDQGWRVEIEQYPLLTETCAFFDPQYNEPPERQGYYSKADIAEIVSYGSQRNVTIVPEIEIPGHTEEVFAAYPELSCNEQVEVIAPYFQQGSTPPFCAGKEEVFMFLENVLTEVAQMFPSQYIHVGGDEVLKSYWQNCNDCQQRMSDENLANEDELQTWFMNRITDFLVSRNKIPIGWTEIIYGGIPDNVAVMSWLGEGAAVTAARAGHDAVMSPISHCYFDYSYGSISTETAYSYEPIPSGLTSAEAEHILGAQGNMWTHIARTETAVSVQIFPRLIALSEVVWSPAAARNWMNFESRLTNHYSRLDTLGVPYYSPDNKYARFYYGALLSHFNSSADLDLTAELTGTFKYAVNIGDGAMGADDLTVGSVTFKSDMNPIPGFTMSNANRSLVAPQLPDYDGGTTAENDLEKVVRSVVWLNSEPELVIELAVDPETDYKLQYMVFDRGFNGPVDIRAFDVWVDGVLIAEEVLFSPTSNDQGTVLTYTFKSSADTVVVKASPGWGSLGDLSPVVSALTLEEVDALWNCSDPIEGDVNGDCYVNFEDIAIACSKWLLSDLIPVPFEGVAVTHFNGTADLDLNNIVYAVGMGDDGSDRTVGGVTFINSANAHPGVTINGGLMLNDQIAPPDLDGGTATEDSLEQLLRDSIFGNGATVAYPSIDFDTTPGEDYRLQIFIYDTGYNQGSDLNRNFDILLEGALRTENTLLETDPMTDHGTLATIDFTASDGETTLSFGKGDYSIGSDTNPVLSAITLAPVDEERPLYCNPLLKSDLNNDCLVDINDLVRIARNWLICNRVPDEFCN